MKQTIFGFSQKQLLGFNCDLVDAIILRWIVDWSSVGNFQTLIEDEYVFYRLDPVKFQSYAPAANISTVQFWNCLTKMVEVGILQVSQDIGRNLYYRIVCSGLVNEGVLE